MKSFLSRLCFLCVLWDHYVLSVYCWRYLHALSSHIFVVDPLQGTNEVEDSRKAGHRFGQYFKMRRNRLGKEDWVNIKWKPGKITHTFQEDVTSCGVFVMQMAKMTVMEFPKMSQSFQIDSSKESLKNQRRLMAEEILMASVSKDEFCSFCGNKNLPAGDDVWIQCGNCTRCHIFVVDPLQVPNEVEDSRKAGHRFEQYFKMHRKRLG
ncbi:hypothetical protein PFLUV_G00222340 [Perca fluviatilis]|uniref:Ubiquitin-like protease family profile domain-containing protein n=1 Tax=Perca fluviatilis TaxID=8168 RepID=A0A6A5E919_PERFL|nr:hypothetical protein PFLUV_G00222340 [Perca fluviatilis]